MPTVNPANALAALIKLQANKLKAKGAEQKTAQDTTAKTLDKQTLKKTAEQRLFASIVAINRQDPDAPRKAFRAYLASRLIAELGEEILRDPGFPALVDKTQATMQEDKELDRMISQVGTQLLLQHQS
jgi:hypothetical protein